MIMRIYLTLIIFFFSAVCASAQDEDITPQNTLSLAEGNWGIQSVNDAGDANASGNLRRCGTSPVIITIDRKALRYKAVYTGENFTAQGTILKATARYLSVQYDNEERLMGNGKPHIWHMVFVENDKFYWVLGAGVSEAERQAIVPSPRVRCRLLTS